MGHQGLFHDEEFGSQGGLIHNRGRTFHPRFARFMQRDPAGYADSYNLYEGLAGNPLNQLDPTGLIITNAQLIAEGYDRQTRETILKAQADLADCDLRIAMAAADQETLENSRVYRLYGGISVTSSTLTFGLTDQIGLTESDEYQSTAFDLSRMVATGGLLWL